MFYGASPVQSTLLTNTSSDKNDSTDFQGLGKGPLYICLIFIIVFENLLVIGAAHMRKRKSIPDILIAMIALSSIVNAIVVLSIMSYVILYQRFAVGKTWALCATQYFFISSLRQFDIFIISLISVDRYLAICKPLLYRTRGKIRHGVIAVMVAFFLALLIATLPFLGFGKVLRDLKTLCTVDWGSAVSILIIVTTYIQFFLVLFCYISIFKTIHSLVHRQKAIERSQNPTYLKVSKKLKQLTLRRGNKTPPKDDLPSPTASIISTKTVESFFFPSTSKQKCLSCETRPRASTMESPRSCSCDAATPDISPAITPLRRISEEGELQDSNLSLTNSDEKTDSDDNLAPLPKQKSEKKPDHKRKLSEMGLINAALEDDDVFENSTEVSRITFVNVDRKVSYTNVADRFERHDEMVDRSLKKGTLQRSVSLPNILSDDVDTEASELGKPGKYRSTRASTPSLKPTLTKQLSSLRDRWKKVLVKRSSSQVKRSWRESRHFANIMGIVVMIYYITYLPLAIHITLRLIVGSTSLVRKWGFYGRNMTLASPFLIPMVYGLMCKPYRKNYKRILSKIFCVVFISRVCMKKESVAVTVDSTEHSKF